MSLRITRDRWGAKWARGMYRGYMESGLKCGLLARTLIH